MGLFQPVFGIFVIAPMLAVCLPLVRTPPWLGWLLWGLAAALAGNNALWFVGREADAPYYELEGFLLALEVLPLLLALGIRLMRSAANPRFPETPRARGLTILVVFAPLLVGLLTLAASRAA